MFKKLLCPIDFSPGSQQALDLAARLAKASDAELIIAHAWHVVPLAYTEYPIAADTLQAMSDDAVRLLGDARERALKLGAKRVGTAFSRGLPWQQIVETAADRSCDLVVIGSHGRTGISRFVLGSVAETVVRHAPCSVLVARNDQASFQHALCAIDFSEASRDAMNRAVELARERVTLFHSIETPGFFAYEPHRAEVADDLDRRATNALDQWAGELAGRSKLTVSCRTAFGSPAHEALGVIDGDPTIDLAVVGSRGRTGIKRVLLGSVAAKIVRHARCSVLVARDRE